MKFLLAMTALVLMAAAGTCMGQQPSIRIFQVAVTDALPLAGVQDKSIVIHLADDAKFPKRFHVRMFRGTPESLIAQGRVTRDANGCAKFASSVITVAARGSLQLGSFDKTWLKSTGASLETEEYTLVFESGDQPGSGAIWLHDAELETYFRHGLRMQLHPNGIPLRQELLMTIKQQMAQQSQELAKITTSVCWVAQDVPERDLAKRRADERFLVARITATECRAAVDIVGPNLNKMLDSLPDPAYGFMSDWTASP